MLAQLVDDALTAACRGIAGLSHAERSAAWVSALASGLQRCSAACAPVERIVAFCRDNDGNRGDFRTNELLFDILVAEKTPIWSPKGIEIQALSRAIWVVESELKRTDARDVLIDLNKLVMAKSVNKVLVISGSTSLLAWAQEAMAKLLDPNESNVYLVTIPHPEEWCEPLAKSAQVYRLSTERRWLTPA